MNARLTTCAQCGASNPASAPWCGQCFTPFQRFDSGLRSELDELAEAIVAARGEEKPEPRPWVCRVCGTPNPVEETVCGGCSLSIFDSVTGERRERRDPGFAVRRGMLFPGLGYGAADQSLIGSIVGFLALVALASGLTLLIGGIASGVLLLAVGIGLWAVGAVDAGRIAAGHDTWMRPRLLSIIGSSVILTALVAIAETYNKVRTR